MDIFEAMDSNRAMRRLKPDPVPRELLEKLVHAATRAPSAGNSQLWDFVVVTERGDMRFLAEKVQRHMSTRSWGRETEGNEPQARLMRAVRYLVTHFEDVPAVIFCCIQNSYPNEKQPEPLPMWSTIYPATQNLLLAARALGLGAVMTTFQIAAENEIKEHFGIPKDVYVASTIPIGYPMGKFGPLGRKPLDEVMHWSRWGAGAAHST